MFKQQEREELVSTRRRELWRVLEASLVLHVPQNECTHIKTFRIEGDAIIKVPYGVPPHADRFYRTGKWKTTVSDKHYFNYISGTIAMTDGVKKHTNSLKMFPSKINSFLHIIC